MDIIIPTSVTTSTLTSTDVVEIETIWLVGTTYAADDLIYLNQNVYKSVQSANMGNNPSTDDGTWWIEYSATNPWKVFDNKIGSVSTKTTSMQYIITPGVEITGLALFNLTATEVVVSVIDAAGIGILYQTVTPLLSTTEVEDWYSYFFEPTNSLSNAAFLDLPSGHATASIKVELKDTKRIIGNNWRFTEDKEAWRNDAGTVTYQLGGTVEVVNTSGYNSFTKDATSIDPSVYQKVRIKARVTDLGVGYSWSGELVYIADSAAYVASDVLTAPTDVTDWNIYEFDLSSDASWTGATTITLLQFRLFQTNVTYEVDWVELITESATTSSTVEVGEIVLGEKVTLGLTQTNPSIGLVDYSNKTTDDFGNVTVVARSFSQKSSFSILVLTENINRITEALSVTRTTPIAWVALEDVDFASSLLTYGYAKDYSMVVSNPIWGILKLQIEGLT